MQLGIQSKELEIKQFRDKLKPIIKKAMDSFENTYRRQLLYNEYYNRLLAEGKVKYDK